MDILFFGNGERGLVSLMELLKYELTIVGIVTEKKDCLEEIKKIASKMNIKLYYKIRVNDKVFLEEIADKNIDWFFVANFSQIFKERLLKIPKKGSINLHGGPLPQYRGSSPMNWAIINGEKQHGVSIIKMDEGIDTGDVIAQKNFNITIKDTIKDVHRKANKAFVDLIPEVIGSINKGKTNFTKQDETKAHYYRLRKPEDGLIIWKHMTAFQVYNMIRSLTHPYPGAFTYHNKKKLFIWSADLIKDATRCSPNTVNSVNKNGALVMCKDKCLLLKSVQLEGDKEKNVNEVLKQGDTLD